MTNDDGLTQFMCDHSWDSWQSPEGTAWGVFQCGKCGSLRGEDLERIYTAGMLAAYKYTHKLLGDENHEVIEVHVIEALEHARQEGYEARGQEA